MDEEDISDVCERFSKDWSKNPVNLVIFGFKGAGKSYFGRKLARYLEKDFIDTDELIAPKNSISQIYRQVGEKEFRLLEERAILRLKEVVNSVIATGGGSLCNPNVLFALQNMGQMIYLKCSFETVLPRILKKGLPAYLQGEKDPILKLRKIYEERCKIYESIDAYVIDGI